ncbi:hypothetical protein GWK74_03060 [Candidatus Saccharibacteria bacterium oral taxon 488]|nr:hypothetical protein GWK74_03060 [Candidatus Saccharibacteria bacterium oral taxon 488]
MLEGLTIIIATIIVLGVVIITTSRDDSFLMVSGMMIASFGATALYWVAKNVAPHLRRDSTIGWLYKPIASLPEWMGHAGLGATAVLWILAIVFLVDDYIHLPRRRKGGNY